MRMEEQPNLAVKQEQDGATCVIQPLFLFVIQTALGPAS